MFWDRTERCVGTIQRRSCKRFKWVQKREAKFANYVSLSVLETLAKRRLIARICALFKTYSGRRTWEAIENRLLKPYYLSWGDHNGKISTRKQRTDVGKYFFVNSTIKIWIHCCILLDFLYMKVTVIYFPGIFLTSSLFPVVVVLSKRATYRCLLPRVTTLRKR